MVNKDLVKEEHYVSLEDFYDEDGKYVRVKNMTVDTFVEALHTVSSKLQNATVVSDYSGVTVVGYRPKTRDELAAQAKREERKQARLAAKQKAQEEVERKLLAELKAKCGE